MDTYEEVKDTNDVYTKGAKQEKLNHLLKQKGLN